MMTLLEIVLRQSPSLRAASLHEEIGWISITIVPCSAVKICDINNHYLHHALINMQVRTCSVVQLSPSWGWAHHWAWIASSGFSKSIFLEFFPSKTKHLLFFYLSSENLTHPPRTFRLSTTESSPHRVTCARRHRKQFWNIESLGEIFLYSIYLAQLSLKFPRMMRMSLSRKPSSWLVSSSLKLWLRITCWSRWSPGRDFFLLRFPHSTWKPLFFSCLSRSLWAWNSQFG